MPCGRKHKQNGKGKKHKTFRKNLKKSSRSSVQPMTSIDDRHRNEIMREVHNPGLVGSKVKAHGKRAF